MSSKGIDYSKWDHFDDDSSSDQDEKTHAQQPQPFPNVTKLEEPSRVTISTLADPDGSTITIHPTTTTITAASASASFGSSQRNKGPNAACEGSSSSSSLQAEHTAAIAEWTLNGSSVTLPTTTSTSEREEDAPVLYWSQDREIVTLRIVMPSTTDTDVLRATQLRVTLQGALPVAQKHCAVMTAENKPTLTICIVEHNNKNNKTDGDENKSSSRTAVTASRRVLLTGQLPYPVYITDDDDDIAVDTATTSLDYDDWTLETIEVGTSCRRRVLVVTLYKATPLPNMTIWWKRPMMQFEERDDIVTTSRRSSFQEAWAQAHQQFQERIQQKEKQHKENEPS